ncbi:ATP-dependent helicase HrpB [Haloglycomyces albus]|uniref:ATP-dependent helicase HrpB n=1 Tax=Haloglycomyces albus TaxID=526067 RepID=UPI00046D08C8|nr:ATP-dependent helicase HrpB [Haloglycomyces albus]
MPTLPELPINQVLTDLSTAVDRHSSAILAAPPGTGKTTVAPLALAGLLDDEEPSRRVVVAEPRRLAARSAAQRMAAILGEPVGETVGYRIRGETRRSQKTRIEVVTTGVLVNQLLADPELPDVDAVMLDECHERHIETDTAAAFIAESRAILRPELAFIAASATADVDLWRVLLPEAPVIETEPLDHPVDIHWTPPAHRDRPLGDKGVSPRFLAHVTGVIERAHATDTGDILCFLPGTAEINRVAGRLDLHDTEVLALHGSVPTAEQNDAMLPRERRRVILATDIAESSVTVPGVRIVVDAGLARRPFIDHARGLPGLATIPAPRSSTAQRAGRAGREGPGVVWRCWSEAEDVRRPAHAKPDIETIDLTAFALQVLCWGTPVDRLPLSTPPPKGAWQAALETLTSLSAIDARCHVTARGREMPRFGVHPRLARALLDGAAYVGTRQAAEVTALLALDRRGRGDDLLQEWKRLRTQGDRQWRKEVKRLSTKVPRIDGTTSDDEAAAIITALAFPERVARRRESGSDQSSRQWLTVSGTGATVTPGSPLSDHRWLAIAEATRARGSATALIRSAVPIDGDVACELVGVAERAEVVWDRERGDVRARRVRTVGAVELESVPLAQPDEDLVRTALEEGLRREGLDLLRWNEGAVRLRQRMAFCHEQLGSPWPCVDDISLVDSTDWLEPWWSHCRRRGDVEAIDVAAALRNLLPWQVRLDDVAPEWITVPSGRRVRVDYGQEWPVVAVKLQEMFGATETPLIAGVGVSLHLLNPAGRPVAITSDLASFWEGPYQEVRKDMRGRYPKHPWPEDPFSVPATAKTKHRLDLPL